MTADGRPRYTEEEYQQVQESLDRLMGPYVPAGHMKIADIKIGNRFRKELGDIKPLMASIDQVGLIHPIAVTRGKQLIAGYRRLQAMRELGREIVPVHVVKGLDDALSRLRAEQDENTCRKDFTPSEAAAIGMKLERLEKAMARKRQGRPGKARSEKSAEHGAKGETAAKVAKAMGMSRDTYKKAKAVVEAAEKEPQKFAAVVEEMDRTGKVDPAYRKVELGIYRDPDRQQQSAESYSAVRPKATIRTALVSLQDAACYYGSAVRKAEESPEAEYMKSACKAEERLKTAALCYFDTRYQEGREGK